MADNKNRQRDSKSVPHVERAKGLIAVWQQTKQEEEKWLRRDGIWSSATPVVGCGRAETLALLCEMATRNVVRTPHQKRGRGRGLESLPLTHPTLEPTNAGTMGMGRVRGRNFGPCPCSDPHMHVPNTSLKCLNPPRDISNPPQRPNLPSPEASSRLDSDWFYPILLLISFL